MSLCFMAEKVTNILPTLGTGGYLKGDVSNWGMLFKGNGGRSQPNRLPADCVQVRQLGELIVPNVLPVTCLHNLGPKLFLYVLPVREDF